jgi:hypothetical protein
MNYINWISEHLDTLFLIVFGLISVAAHIAALTPSTKDDAAVSRFRKFIDLLAGNYGHARNKDA